MRTFPQILSWTINNISIWSLDLQRDLAVVSRLAHKIWDPHSRSWLISSWSSLDISTFKRLMLLKFGWTTLLFSWNVPVEARKHLTLLRNTRQESSYADLSLTLEETNTITFIAVLTTGVLNSLMLPLKLYITKRKMPLKRRNPVIRSKCSRSLRRSTTLNWEILLHLGIRSFLLFSLWGMQSQMKLISCSKMKWFRKFKVSKQWRFSLPLQCLTSIN